MAQHPEVRQAVVKPWKDRLAAFVELRRAGSVCSTDLRAFLGSRLPEHMVPASFSFLAELPRTPHGKLDRSALATPAEETEDLPRVSPPPDPVEARLIAIWRKVLGVGRLGTKENFFDLGGHSLNAIALVAEVERTFGKRLPIAALFQAPTVASLANLLRDCQPASGSSSLVPIQTSGSRVPFFAVHAHSGQIMFYRALARRLGQDQPFYGLQSAGLDGDHRPLTRVEDMAAHYLREVRSVQSEGPYCLGGYCVGAYVAFEMARQLEADGQEVALLAAFVSDGSWRGDGSSLKAIEAHLRRITRSSAWAGSRYITRRLRFRLTRMGYRLADLACAALLLMKRPLPSAMLSLHIRERNYRANRRYVARPYGASVTYFQPEGAPWSVPERFWGRVATAGISVRMVPGVEEDVFREPNVAALAESLRACLGEAQTAGRESPSPSSRHGASGDMGGGVK